MSRKGDFPEFKLVRLGGSHGPGGRATAPGDPWRAPPDRRRTRWSAAPSSGHARRRKPRYSNASNLLQPAAPPLRHRRPDPCAGQDRHGPHCGRIVHVGPVREPGKGQGIGRMQRPILRTGLRMVRRSRSRSRGCDGRRAGGRTWHASDGDRHLERVGGATGRGRAPRMQAIEGDAQGLFQQARGKSCRSGMQDRAQAVPLSGLMQPLHIRFQPPACCALSGSKAGAASHALAPAANGRSACAFLPAGEAAERPWARIQKLSGAALPAGCRSLTPRPRARRNVGRPSADGLETAVEFKRGAHHRGAG